MGRAGYAVRVAGGFGRGRNDHGRARGGLKTIEVAAVAEIGSGAALRRAGIAAGAAAVGAGPAVAVPGQAGWGAAA